MTNGECPVPMNCIRNSPYIHALYTRAQNAESTGKFTMTNREVSTFCDEWEDLEKCIIQANVWCIPRERRYLFIILESISYTCSVGKNDLQQSKNCLGRFVISMKHEEECMRNFAITESSLEMSINRGLTTKEQANIWMCNHLKLYGKCSRTVMKADCGDSASAFYGRAIDHALQYTYVPLHVQDCQIEDKTLEEATRKPPAPSDLTPSTTTIKTKYGANSRRGNSAPSLTLPSVFIFLVAATLHKVFT